MAIPVFEAYEKSVYHFRGSRDPRKKKTIGYFMDMSKSIYSTFLNGFASTSLADVERFSHNRRYSRNEQSEEQYKEYFSKGAIEVDNQRFDKATQMWYNAEEGKRKGFMNVIWKIVKKPP